MPMLRRPAFLFFAVLSLFLTACGEPEDTRPGQPVAHRRAAFKAILDAFEPISAGLRQKKYVPEDYIAMAKRLNEVKDGPWPYFTPDSNYPPTRATDKVWSERDKFDLSRQAFLTASEKLLAAAQARNEEQVRAAYEALHQTCRDCHKAFRK